MCENEEKRQTLVERLHGLRPTCSCEHTARRSPWDSAAIKRRLDLSRTTTTSPNPHSPKTLLLPPLRLPPIPFLLRLALPAPRLAAAVSGEISGGSKRARQGGSHVAPRAEPERRGAQQVGGAAHEHQRRQGPHGRAQDQPRPQGHHQDVNLRSLLSPLPSPLLSSLLDLEMQLITCRFETRSLCFSARPVAPLDLAGRFEIACGKFLLGSRFVVYLLISRKWLGAGVNCSD